MFIKRENATLVLRIDSKLGTCRPVYLFKVYCDEDQELAELLCRQLKTVITNTLEKIARDNYNRGFSDAKAKRKRDDWPDVPWDFE